MFTLDLESDIIYIKDLRFEQLPQILKWYNNVDDFKFATGIDEPISFDILIKKYTEIFANNNVFFAGIYLKSEDKLIGILKGSLRYRSKDAVWISSIVVDHEYQNRGYGGKAVELMLNYLKNSRKIKDAYLAVVNENIQGRSFWKKNSFKELGLMEKSLRMQNKHQKIIIMHKQI